MTKKAANSAFKHPKPITHYQIRHTTVSCVRFFLQSNNVKSTCQPSSSSTSLRKQTETAKKKQRRPTALTVEEQLKTVAKPGRTISLHQKTPIPVYPYPYPCSWWWWWNQWRIFVSKEESGAEWRFETTKRRSSAICVIEFLRNYSRGTRGKLDFFEYQFKKIPRNAFQSILRHSCCTRWF